MASWGWEDIMGLFHVRTHREGGGNVNVYLGEVGKREKGKKPSETRISWMLFVLLEKGTAQGKQSPLSHLTQVPQCPRIISSSPMDIAVPLCATEAGNYAAPGAGTKM